ncbi:lipoprotein putative [Vibrio astriarenae]|nr:lipoprotein putative [Vibrio sp. C7]
MKLNSDRLKNKHHKNRWLACIPLVLLTLVFGCATSTKIDNELKDNNPDQESYSAVSATEKFNDGDVTILIAFSGGGTRAAAFSYGVLKALNDTQLKSTSNKVSILDEVDLISSVSGGSFTSAYYGLYGTRIFSDFENDFLYKDIGRDLYYNFINH